MNDSISRQEVLALIQSFQTPYRKEVNIEDIYDAVLHMPSAQGKWIPCDVDSRGMTNMFVCSKCGSFTSLPILKYANAMEYEFCPNCGARMEGEDHED